MSGVELRGLVGLRGDWALTDTLGENSTDQRRLRVVQPAVPGQRGAGRWSVAALLGLFFGVDVALEVGSARFHAASVGIAESSRLCNW